MKKNSDAFFWLTVVTVAVVAWIVTNDGSGGNDYPAGIVCDAVNPIESSYAECYIP